MSDQQPFAGFDRPKNNYYRLPNNWFEEVIPLMRREYGDRFVGPIKMTEYVLRHTWGQQNWDGALEISADQIQNGRKSSKHSRSDQGTGLSPKTINRVGEALVKLGILKITQDQTDKARRLKTYTPNIKAEEVSEIETAEDFKGFNPPEANYFMVPMAWTDMTRDITSGPTIVITEYMMRHAWGYNNPDGTWMTIDEIANGRKHKTSDDRYDQGTGFGEPTIYKALSDAIERGLIVWIEVYDRGNTYRLYNLRLTWMEINPVTGICLNPPSDKTKNHNKDNNKSNTTTEDNSPKDDQQPSDNAPGNNGNNLGISANTYGNNANDLGNSDNADRSLKDTNNPHTKDKIPRSTTPPRKWQNKKSRKAKLVDVVDLPPEILAGLDAIGWMGETTEIQIAYAKSQELVIAWLQAARHVRDVDNLAGYFRSGVRKGIMPKPIGGPKPKNYQVPDYATDDVDIDDGLSQDTPDHATNPDLDPKIFNAWQSVLAQLSQEVPRGHYIQYVQQTHVHDYQDGVMHVLAPDKNQQEWLDSHIKTTAERLLIGVLCREIDVQFVTAGGQLAK